MGKIKGKFKIINPPLYIIDNHIGVFYYNSLFKANNRTHSYCVKNQINTTPGTNDVYYSSVFKAQIASQYFMDMD